MTLNTIIDSLKFPLIIVVEKDSIREVFESKNSLISKYYNYRLFEISIDSNLNFLRVVLEKPVTLEDLGYSFESGM